MATELVGNFKTILSNNIKIYILISVQMKGKVACEMGNHELIITELVFHNVLTELQPAEIAALLSCLVFQQKNASEPHLTPVLEKVNFSHFI